MFSITIRYKFSEYTLLLKTLSEQELGKSVVQKWYFGLVAYPLWFFIYLFKLGKEGKCTFTFSETGFERTSNSGTSRLELAEIGKFVETENMFLLVGASKGIAPIPKRCLTNEQIGLLKSWTQSKYTTEI